MRTSLFTLNLLVLILLMTQIGCATLNQSECQVANWEIIGMEDASAGRASSYIGQHRSACAEYGISPNLTQYMKGYEKGLKQFCTYQNGFNIGNSGRGYSGICQGNLKNRFLSGYQKGQEEFAVRQNISNLKRDLNNAHHRFDQIEREVVNKKELIVASTTSSEQRRRLLREIEELNEEKQVLVIEIAQMEEDLFRLEDEYARKHR